MNSRHLLVPVTLVTLLLAAAALAESGNRPAPGGDPQGGNGDRPPRPPIDTALDASGDEVIDATEIAGASTALAKIDRSGDGQLTADEYLPARPRGAEGSTRGSAGEATGRPNPPQGAPAGGRPTPPIVAAIDLDGNGILAAAEIAKASTSLLKLDRNGDGQLSPDEYRPPRPGEGGRPEGSVDSPPERTGGAGTPRGEAGRAGIVRASNHGAGSPATVSGVVLAFDPLRLVVSGAHFRNGATVKVNGTPAPNTIYKTDGLLVAAGALLESALPKGSPVAVVVANPDGTESSPWTFTR